MKTMLQGKAQEKSPAQLDELLLCAMNCYHNGHYEKALTVFQIIALSVKVIPSSLWLACAACLAEIGHVSECILVVQYVCSQQLSRELRLEALTIVISAILNETLSTRNTQHLLQLEAYIFELRAIDETNPLIFITYALFFTRTYSLALPSYFTSEYIETVTSQSLLAEFYRARLLHTMGKVSAANELYEKVYHSTEILCRDTHTLQYEHYKALYNAALEGSLISELYIYCVLKGRTEMCSLGYVDLHANGDDSGLFTDVDEQQEDSRTVHKSVRVESQISRVQTRIHMHYAALAKSGISLAPNIVMLVALVTQGSDILVKQVSGSINPLLITPILHLNRFSYSNAKDLVLAIASSLSYLLLINAQPNDHGMGEQSSRIQYIRLVDHPGYRSILNNGARTAMNDLRWHEFPCFAAEGSQGLSSFLTPFLSLDLDTLLILIREGNFEDSFARDFIAIFPDLFYNIALIALRASDYSVTLLFLCISIYASAVKFLLLGGVADAPLSNISATKLHLVSIASSIKLFHDSPAILETRPDILKILLHAPFDTCYALCYFLKTFGFSRPSLYLSITLSHLYLTPKLPIFIANLLRAEGAPPLIQAFYLFGPRATAVLSTNSTDSRTIWNLEALNSIHPRLLAYLALLVDPTDQSESISVYQKALSTSIKAQEKNKISQLFCETAMIYLVTTKICYYVSQKYLVRNLHSDFGKDISLFNRIAQDNEDVVRFLTKLIVGLNEKLANYEKTVDYYYKYLNTESYTKHRSFDYSPTVFNLKMCLTNLTSAKAALCGVYGQSLLNMTCLLNHISSPASCDRKAYMGYTFTAGCIGLAHSSPTAASYFQNALISGLLMCVLPRSTTDQSGAYLLSVLTHANKSYERILEIYNSSAQGAEGRTKEPICLTSPEVDAEIRNISPIIPLSLLLYLSVALYDAGSYMECLSILKTLLLQYPLPRYPLLSTLLVTVLEAVIAPMSEHVIGRKVKLLQAELRRVLFEQQLDSNKEYDWLFANQSGAQSRLSNKAVLPEIEKTQKLCEDLNSLTGMPSNDTLLKMSETYARTENGYSPLNVIREKIIAAINEQLEAISSLKTRFSVQLDNLMELYKTTANLFQLTKQDAELCIMYLGVMSSLIQETASCVQSDASTVGSESLFLNIPSYPWLSATYPRFLSKIGSSKSTFSMYLSPDTDYNSYQLEAMSDRYGVPVYVESFVRSYMSIHRIPLIRKVRDYYAYYLKEVENINRTDALVKRLKDLEKMLIKAIITCQTVVRNAQYTKSAVKLDIHAIARQNEELMRRNDEAIGLHDQHRYRLGERTSKEHQKKRRVQHPLDAELEQRDEYLWEVHNTEVGVGSDRHDSTPISSRDNVYEENDLLDPQMPLNMEGTRLDENDDI